MIVKRNLSCELYHHGIKGQKWGVRRYQNADGSLTDAGRKRYTEEQIKDLNVRNERKKNLKNRRILSDEDLRGQISRMRLEQDFKNISERDIKPGKKFCDDFLTNYGKTILTSVATGATMLTLNALITRNISPEKAAQYLAPLPKRKR